MANILCVMIACLAVANSSFVSGFGSFTRVP